jgi:hypothetical protein
MKVLMHSKWYVPKMPGLPSQLASIATRNLHHDKKYIDWKYAQDHILGLKLNEHNIDFISNILKTVSLLIL